MFYCSAVSLSLLFKHQPLCNRPLFLGLHCAEHYVINVLLHCSHTKAGSKVIYTSYNHTMGELFWKPDKAVPVV